MPESTARRPAVTFEMLAELGLAASMWQKHLRAENKSPRTIQTYSESVLAFGRWMLARPEPVLELGRIDRETMKAFMADQLAAHKATTASVRFRALQQFFKFCVAEGDIAGSPMEGMKPPILPEDEVPVIPDEDITLLIRACAGTGFFDRRDMALVRFFLDTGVRVSEAAGLEVTDVDLGADVAHVIGKGRKGRAVAFGDKTALALSRYLKARAAYVREKRLPGLTASEGRLWVGIRGPMTAAGIEQAFDRRCDEAGIAHVHPHQFRHTFSHQFLLNGGQTQDLMLLNGWKDPKMAARYGKSAGAERARRAHRKFSPGDRF